VSQVFGTLESGVVASTAERLRDWIVSGACQDGSGAFGAWRDLATGGLAYTYPEITGYALTFLAGVTTLPDHGYSVATHAAEWLTKRFERGNLAARDGWDGDTVYLFDLGMAASGLLSFGTRVQVDRFVGAGRNLAGFVAAQLRSSDGLSAIAPGGPRSGRRAWSTLGQAHLAKLVQSLLLAEECGSQSERVLGSQVIDQVKRLQLPDGHVPTGQGDGMTMLHPHLYAAEGMWIWGSATGDSDSLERARAAVEWAWTHQLETGGFPRSVGVDGNGAGGVEQSDVTAQATRLAHVFGLRSDGLDRAVARLVDVTRPWGGSSAVLYQPASADRHLNTWSTLFAAQALELAADESRSLSWAELV
jgi:hypothetical protein